MVPVEVQSAGRPVIALAKGGALETVIPEKTGVFFDEPSTDHLVRAIERFESNDAFPPAALHEHARQFSCESFNQRFSDFVTFCIEHHDRNRPHHLDDVIKSAFES